MPTPPVLSREQRLAGYYRALELRQSRAMLKEALRIGAVQLCDAWSMETAQGMKVFDLLMAIPGIGQAKAQQILDLTGAKHPERLTVRGCGPKQKQAIFDALS